MIRLTAGPHLGVGRSSVGVTEEIDEETSVDSAHFLWWTAALVARMIPLSREVVYYEGSRRSVQGGFKASRIGTELTGRSYPR